MRTHSIRSILIIISFFILSNLSLKAQVPLKIIINNLDNNKGTLILDFRDGEDNFIKGFSQEIIDHQCIIELDSLKWGMYSFKYFHDENNNKKLDTYWFGAPKEGYGFSNDAQKRLAPPSLKEITFELKSDTTMVSIPRYINL